MLVLSRRVGERLLINQVWVEVLEISAGRVRLGFEGPANVPIYRQEVWADMQRHGPRRLARPAA